MNFLSTRDPAHTATLSEAIRRGIAPDGGLYVPERLPRRDLAEFDGLDTAAEIAVRLLEPFLEGDPLAPALPEICRAALDFPLPLRTLRDRTAVLELFHGPTAAFKDVGARFLAQCLTRLPRAAERPLTILVATSGDTGGAVAAAFHGAPGIEVVILFPKGRISARQEKQLTCWGDNIVSLAVRGDFDDCQRLVKEAFADPALRAARDLSSANSINLGRLLPQTVYHAAAALAYRREHGADPGVIVPSGNLGNGVAALWARAMGMPIREVVLATNANRVIPDFLDTGEWTPHETVATLANAMDVGLPSNMERVLHLLPGVDRVRGALRAFAVDDATIRERIRGGAKRWGEVWDPHTATAVDVRERLGGEHWIVVATAHPAKFETVVEPLIGSTVPVPPALAALLDRASHSVEIEPTLDALRAALEPPSGGGRVKGADRDAASAEHERFVREAIELSRAALRRGDGAYGALLVRDGRVLLRAENTTRSEGDLTRHAEMVLLVDAQRAMSREELAGCTLYASTEPCAMCAGAIVYAEIGRVVFGCSVPRQVEIRGGGIALRLEEVLRSAGVEGEIEVVGPVLEEEAAAVLREAARVDAG